MRSFPSLSYHKPTFYKGVGGILTPKVCLLPALLDNAHASQRHIMLYSVYTIISLNNVFSYN